MTHPERRKSARLARALPVQLSSASVASGRLLEARTVNVSAHGALCELSEGLPLMTKVDVCFFIPGRASAKATTQQFRLSGVVVRVEQMAQRCYQIALFFSGMSASKAAKLRRCLQS